MSRETSGTSMLSVRVSPDLRRRVKIAAIMADRTQHEIVVEALRVYLVRLGDQNGRAK